MFSGWLDEEIQTKGGEALPEQVMTTTPEPFNTLIHAHAQRHRLDAGQWYALWTHSHCEQLVHDYLQAKGFEMFLPKIEVWSRRGVTRQRIPAPMFPGYLFLRDDLDHPRYTEILKARGLVCVLGSGWGRLGVVPRPEIEAIQKVVEAKVPALSYPYLRTGQRVRITSGPLRDVEWILVHTKPDKGLLVVSIDLFQRSVAVEVDCTLAVAA